MVEVKLDRSEKQKGGDGAAFRPQHIRRVASRQQNHKGDPHHYVHLGISGSTLEEPLALHVVRLKEG